MENIQHKYVDVRGLKLHVADIGTGPAVLFVHGFPEIWYSWRHQMMAVADSGFRALAPDCRGYGLSEKPAEPEKTTFRDLVEDLVEIINFLAIPKVFLVAKDFGVRPAYHLALLHPDRVSAVITLGVPFILAGPDAIPPGIPKGFYMHRWREPGRAENDFGRFDVKTVVKKIYTLFTKSELQVARDDQEIMDLVDHSAPLPSWFSEEDLTNYATLYENSGFQTPLQVPYRAWLENYDGVDDLKVRSPALLIMGEKDYALKFGPLAEYILSGMVNQYVPDLEVTYIPEGTHFVQEQFPEQVNHLILVFLNKHK